MTAKKSEWIEYPCNYGYYKHDQKFQGTDIQIPQKFSALNSIRVNKYVNTIQMRDRENCYFSGDLYKTILELQKYDESHDEAIIDQDHEYGLYGDPDRDIVYIAGWRTLTDEKELALANEYVEAFKAAKKKTNENKKLQADVDKLNALDAARKLLKDAGEL